MEATRTRRTVGEATVGDNTFIDIGSNPLKLDSKWYCNCMDNGEAVLKSTQALAKSPEVYAVLLVQNTNQNLNFGTQGIQALYKSPYCGVPALAELQQQAIAKSFEFKCPRIWGSNRCDNHRNGLREQYLAEVVKNHDAMCQEAARNEALLIESIATKANTEAKTQMVEQNYSPEARAEAEADMKQKTRQTTWIVLGVVVLIGVAIWQVMKK